jgi:hypothetical protein
MNRITFFLIGSIKAKSNKAILRHSGQRYRPSSNWVLFGPDGAPQLSQREYLSAHRKQYLNS